MNHFHQSLTVSRTYLNTRVQCHRLMTPIRRTLRFVVVFLLLLCAAESLLSLAVYLGYSGGTYLQRVHWHKDGSLTFAEFQREVMRPRGGGGEGGDGVGQGEEVDAGQMTTSTTTVQARLLLPPCPLVPPGLRGPVKVNMKPPPSFRQLEETFSMLQPGGRYSPPTCRPNQKLAIIIPYRDRRVHLKIFLRNMHPFLQKQQLDYTIFAIELKEGIDFNRAMLFNIGFNEALKVDNFTCFIFHDVDLLPEDDRNFYKCSELPRHMSVAVDRMKYKLPYNTIFGGVSALSREQFQQVNGFSNMYFGWGGEDDDMFRRIRSHGLNVVRFTGDVARYRSMSHAKADKNPSRIKLLHKGAKRFLTDGLNSLNYTRLDFQLKKLYTWVWVEVDQKAITARAEEMLSPKTVQKRKHS
ncbi:beta-1,4-N-acetylgalactosaminyltransferase bre-4-like [Babylonia areolata]|uniref:beta-1,4-N-acetylgalactosaminyltransferase bre-4-like n=1 Tax=Babylonia areolata TaxID=304850 RepID=UPI003FCFC38D